MKKIILGLVALCTVFALTSCNLEKALTITNNTGKTIIVELKNNGESVLSETMKNGASIAKAGDQVPTFTDVFAEPENGKELSWENSYPSKKVFNITFSGIYTDSSGYEYIKTCSIDAL